VGKLCLVSCHVAQFRRRAFRKFSRARPGLEPWAPHTMLCVFHSKAAAKAKPTPSPPKVAGDSSFPQQALSLHSSGRDKLLLLGLPEKGEGKLGPGPFSKTQASLAALLSSFHTLHFTVPLGHAGWNSVLIYERPEAIPWPRGRRM
jgi:hypothetical protein